MIVHVPILILGILISVMGIINMTGNINSLHSYHRHRVKEEDRLAFGRTVGSGTLTIGIGCVLFSVLMMIYDATATDALVWIGVAWLLLCIIIGLALSFWGMIKYNKGIF